ncbi:hypothetical protein [Candidatus Formimonas warabiya]|uniref:Uncharacterized protein n=1 Tax=Formimonas warabiya TaxID=1761012 RepID=A0A3G1KS13_FORW1|nr:hypothetical protein [Candidatus Formimonas warabiya]ATW25236.1 hypothetical protein DCMF_11070 [Candidatus Formimonas warabiya]
MENKERRPKTEVQGLNENHLRVISGTLRLIEKDMDEMERYLRNAPQGRMYETRDDLTESQKEKVLKIIKTVKECINEFANMLHFEPNQESLSGIIRGTLSIHWVNACDIEPKKLKAYGMVDPDNIERLSFYTQKIMDLLHGF